MRRKTGSVVHIVIAVFLAANTFAARTLAQEDVLPSWTEGPAKKAMVYFVQRVTIKSGSDFVSPAERIAAFDNDGTLIVHHDDADREYAYDRNSAMGLLDKALSEANARGWTVVSMKNDWKTIFPPARQSRNDEGGSQ